MGSFLLLSNDRVIHQFTFLFICLGVEATYYGNFYMQIENLINNTTNSIAIGIMILAMTQEL